MLAESFRAHHPDSPFFALLVDTAAPELLEGAELEVLAPADVGIDAEELARRATMYAAQGLVASMKADLLRELLAREAGPVVLLDADGLVCADLTPLASLAAEHSLVLSPHTLDPHPLGVEDSPEQIILRAGVINAGLLAVDAGAGAFLDWWAERTARRCVFDEGRGLMLAQTWLTLAVTLFEHHVLRDRGCNVAGWNLQARDVVWDGETPRIDGGPLRHFHFAGSFDPATPDRLTTIPAHAEWWPALAERPGVSRLAAGYAARLIRHGYRAASAAGPANRQTPGGMLIEPWMRECYREALTSAERAGREDPPNPFSHGDARFLAWLERAAARRVESETPARGESSSDRELTAALLDRRELLARIAELERDRAEAVMWAERASSELEPAREALLARGEEREELAARIRLLDGELAETRAAIEEITATMQAVWRSPSWRLTKPLRGVKSLLARAPRETRTDG